jgi:NTP pyrophosphatase (non-canonical NTP hydrolase)
VDIDIFICQRPVFRRLVGFWIETERRDMKGHFNELMPAELERLALLSEECGEVIQIIGKIIRHGYESCNPNDPEGVTNRELLEKELGDVDFATALLCRAKDVRRWKIESHSEVKGLKIGKYLHHQAQPGPTPAGIAQDSKTQTST